MYYREIEFRVSMCQGMLSFSSPQSCFSAIDPTLGDRVPPHHHIYMAGRVRTYGGSSTYGR